MRSRSLRKFLERLFSAAQAFPQILRMLGYIEISWFLLLGALIAFVGFGGFYLLMLLELATSWLGIPFDFMTEDLGPITFRDFVESTLIVALIIFLTGNFLYGRFFMSEEKAEAMFKDWEER